MLRIPFALLSICVVSCASGPVAEPTDRIQAVPTAHVVIEDDFEAARAAAVTAERPLLVNFSSRTCVNCRMMETSIFERPEVAAALAPYVEARLHQDATDEEARAAHALLVDTIGKSNAMPIYVALDPRSGDVIARFSGATQDPGQFADFLNEANRAR